jgi:transposase
MRQSFRDDSVNEAQIKFWYRSFKDGWESVESNPRSGRPSTSRTPEKAEHVWAVINENGE